MEFLPNVQSSAMLGTNKLYFGHNNMTTHSSYNAINSTTNQRSCTTGRKGTLCDHPYVQKCMVQSWVISAHTNWYFTTLTPLNDQQEQ
jgi:hypothetical protein